MYSIDREVWAKILNISTRTLDRYIRSGKIRSIKKGKKVFLNNDDVEIIKRWWIQEWYEIITKDSIEDSGFQKKELVSYKDLYEKTILDSEKKDIIIKDLSYKLWVVESELKNSISLLEYKKTTFLLESTTNKSEQEKKDLEDNIKQLEEKSKNTILLNYLLIWVLFIAIIMITVLWFNSL